MKLVSNDKSFGDLMTLEEWLQSVKSNFFIDYDGMGEYATATHHWEGENETEDSYVYPSYVGTDKWKPPEGCTHILWYNK